MKNFHMKVCVLILPSSKAVLLARLHERTFMWVFGTEDLESFYVNVLTTVQNSIPAGLHMYVATRQRKIECLNRLKWERTAKDKATELIYRTNPLLLRRRRKMFAIKIKRKVAFCSAPEKKGVARHVCMANVGTHVNMEQRIFVGILRSCMCASAHFDMPSECSSLWHPIPDEWCAFRRRSNMIFPARKNALISTVELDFDEQIRWSCRWWEGATFSCL